MKFMEFTMAKKIKVTSKKGYAVKVTSKSCPRVDPHDIAKALGAEIITDPEEIKKFEKKYGLPHSLLPRPKKK